MTYWPNDLLFDWMADDLLTDWLIDQLTDLLTVKVIDLLNKW